MPATASGRRTAHLESSTFRLTLVYLFVYATSTLALLTLVYLLVVGFMERQSMETIEAEIEGLREQHQLSGISGLARIVRQRTRNDPDRLGIYLLVDGDGRPIAGNIEQWPDPIANRNGTLVFNAVDRGEDGLLAERPVIAKDFGIVNSDGRVVGRLLVGRDISDKRRTQIWLRNSILWGVLLTLVVGFAGGYAMSRYSLGKLERINRTTRQIIAGNLGERVALTGRQNDEFDELAHNLNAMLERIQRLLNGMREVTDNIAHDLRTPLTRMRSRIEVALMKELDREQSRRLLEETMHDADALISTFNALLSIARAEADDGRQECEDVDLAAVVEDVVELYEPLAEEKAVRLEWQAEPGLVIRGNRQLIAQALSNLVDNAIKYSSKQGRVEVEARAQATGGAILAVGDNGPGIPDALKDKATERFVRLDADRSHPGNGLGLSLVKAVASMHRAGFALTDNDPGLKVILTFATPEPSPRPLAAREETTRHAPQAA